MGLSLEPIEGAWLAPPNRHESLTQNVRLRPRRLAWWGDDTNLLGCIAFMLSAFPAYMPRAPFPAVVAVLSVIFTLLGAIGFLAGSLLMLPEASAARQGK